MKTLLWSEQGEVACEQHAPARGTDSWVIGRWRPVTLNERVDFEAEVGHPPVCETCAAIARRAS